MSWMFAVGCGNGDDDDDTTTDAGGKDGTAPTLDATSPGDDDATTPADAAADTGIIGSQDSGVKDAAADSTVPPGSDAGDAGEDAGEDAGHDAGADAGDAAVDAGTLPLFHTVGRWTTGATSISAAWPGSGLTVTFSGATLLLNVTDALNANSVSGTAGGDYLAAFIDEGTANAKIIRPIAIAAAGSQTTIASGLATGTHTAQIYKITDADVGTITVTNTTTGPGAGTPFTTQNAGAGGAIIPAASPFTTKIEFIGDELTAGTGDLSTCAGTSADNDESQSYAGLVSQYFNADHVTAANFQMGLTANGYFAANDLVGTYYPRTLPYADTTATWNFASFVPQAVVINLGSMTDIVSDGEAVPATFQSSLVTFLTSVYTQYKAGTGPYIVLVTGPEYAGNPTTAQETTFQTAVQNALATFKTNTGATKASFVAAPTYDSVCSGFPDATSNAATAKAVEDAIGAFLGKAGP